jgi:hypothetical protein
VNLKTDIIIIVEYLKNPNIKGDKMLKKYLEDLESRISPAVEDELFAQWQRFWNRSIEEEFFAPVRTPSASKLEWPKVNINDAIEDKSFELMLLQQLYGVNDVLSGSNNGTAPAIRANYGSNIMPSLFGVDVVMMAHEIDTLPGSRPLSGGPEKIERLLDKGIPHYRSGQGAVVFDCAQFFLETLKDYPKLQKYCWIYHPDLQGPFDICEVVWGSDIFISLYDAPELVRQFMKLITETYISFIDEWFKLVPPRDDFNNHYGWIHPGKIRLSLDSCMNLSPGNYMEFVKKCDARLLNRYGGIAHSCGKVDHFVPLLSDIQGYCAFNLSQPSYNNMEFIYQNTIDKNIPILGLAREAVESAIKHGRKFHGLAHIAI